MSQQNNYRYLYVVYNTRSTFATYFQQVRDGTHLFSIFTFYKTINFLRLNLIIFEIRFEYFMGSNKITYTCFTKTFICIVFVIHFGDTNEFLLHTITPN